MEVRSKVPLDALYKCWHNYPRLDKRYYTADLITDILSGGGSSRLYQSLVKEKQLFSNINCFHFGSVDAGLIAIEGKLVKGVKMQEAENAIEAELEMMKNEMVSETELEKVKNKTESLMAFEDVPLMSRAGSLATYELLGDANLMNKELEHYQGVTAQDIQQESKNIFTKDNCSTLYYYSEN
jgi:predicted Zn-dependent peptidase